jgi:hypothetical protein
LNRTIKFENRLTIERNTECSPKYTPTGWMHKDHYRHPYAFILTTVYLGYVSNRQGYIALRRLG